MNRLTILLLAAALLPLSAEDKTPASVCGILANLASYNGKNIALRGKLVGTDEGQYLSSEDCTKPLVTSGYVWPRSHTSIFLTPAGSPVYEEMTDGEYVCSVAPEAVKALSNYMAWSEAWLKRDGVPVGSTPFFKVVKKLGHTFFYLRSNQGLYDYFPDSEGSQIGFRTCAEDRWVGCAEHILQWTGQSSIPDALLGIPPRQKVRITPEELCDLKIARPFATQWSPSPESILKSQLLAEIAKAVHSDSRGPIKTAVCNDFNVLDPQVWAVVDVQDGQQNTERILEYVDLNSKPPFYVKVSRFEEASDSNGSLIERILARPLKLRADTR